MFKYIWSLRGDKVIDIRNAVATINYEISHNFPKDNNRIEMIRESQEKKILLLQQ